MLDDPVLAELWCNAAAALAQGEVPQTIAEGLAVHGVNGMII